LTVPNKTERRVIVDTHRHPIGPKLAAKMAESGLYDPKQEFPQANDKDLICYREFFDLDYAMPKQREGGVTLSLASNGGEVEWFARDLLQVSTGDALKILIDEYLEIRDRYPGEFALMANAHALEEACRPIVEDMISQGGAKAIAVASSTATARIAPSSTAPRLNGYGNLRQRMTSWFTFTHRCCRSGTRRSCNTASTKRLADRSTRPSTAPG
jgi:hypothetical protein